MICPPSLSEHTSKILFDKSYINNKFWSALKTRTCALNYCNMSKKIKAPIKKHFFDDSVHNRLRIQCILRQSRDQDRRRLRCILQRSQPRDRLRMHLILRWSRGQTRLRMQHRLWRSCPRDRLRIQCIIRRSYATVVDNVTTFDDDDY